MSERSAYTLRLPGQIAIGLTSTGNLELGPDEQLLLGAYLPDMQLEEQVAADAQVLVSHTESASKGLRQGSQEVSVHDTWNGRYTPDLPHLLYGVARSLWIRRGIYPVHAASVGNAEQFLLPGNSGTGKSTVSLELATKYGQKMFSGNTTLVAFENSGMTAIAGTRTMTLRTEDYRQRQFDSGHSVGYGDRTAFLLDPELYADSLPQQVGRIALVRLTDYTRRWDRMRPAGALHQLYPQFMDVLREDAIVADGAGVFVGDAPPESRRALTRSLQASLAALPVWQGEGTTTYIAERMLEP